MALKWNDDATYMGGNPPKAYNRGDIIPEHIFSSNVLKMYMSTRKIIEAEPVRIPKIKMSISVMAHPSRAHNFDYLKEKLGDVPFAIDQKNNLLENCKAAWRLHDKTADFHVVIQDDAIICNNFQNRAEQFITDVESKRLSVNDPVYGYNFFVRGEYDFVKMREFEKQGYIMEARNRGGVAICLPVNQIESMLEYFDTLQNRHDDERISQWVIKNKFKMIFPIPSLIDHNDHNPSIAGNIPAVIRQAYKFIDNEKLIIPKIIHQLWVGDKPAPTKWMKTWREKNPGWLYRLWTEKEIMAESWINKKHIDYYMERKIWHGVSDVCTYEILYNYGGFMPGADSVCLLPIDELFTDEYDSYACYEQEQIRPGLISPLSAAVKHSKFALELIEGLNKLDKVGEPWISTGNKYMGEMFRKTKQKVKVFPSYIMNPEHLTGKRYEGSGKIYAEQMWGTTKNTYASGVEGAKIKLSISVMAHLKRSDYFSYLIERLGEVPFAIDQKNNLLENSKAAWRLYDPECDFHVVIQDDCIVCDDFKNRAIEFITEQEEKRISEGRKPQGYNFFLKNADDGSKLIINDNFYIDEWTRAGLAICLPKRLIEPMLIEFDKQVSRHDDDRISGFMRLNGYKIVFPFPSLIDHRIELESLAGNVVGQHAIKFIDNKDEADNDHNPSIAGSKPVVFRKAYKFIDD